jgi:hypothetical protein
MKEGMLLKTKIIKYKIGDHVKVKIPKGDRHKIDRTHLPCKILQVIKDDKYQLGCQFGVLEISYSARNLEPLEANISELEEIPRKVISLKEAVKLQTILLAMLPAESQTTTLSQENFEVTCKCPKTDCNTMHCPCKKANRKCNVSCHPIKECLNL